MKSPLTRIMDQLALVDTSDPQGCHEWPGSTANGYGHIGGGRRGAPTLSVPRVLLAAKLGRDLYDGEVARHTCDNPPCCNPEHLIPGTKADNSQDMVNRGRSTRGERQPNHKVSEADVREIRASTEPQSVIAERFGISQGAVSMIRSGQRWGHIT